MTDDFAIIDGIEKQGQTLQIWEIARAITVSISSAFNPMYLEVGTEGYGLSDGSSWAYNPSSLAFSSIADTGPRSFLFSIGTRYDFDEPLVRHSKFLMWDFPRYTPKWNRIYQPDESAFQALGVFQKRGELEYLRTEVKSDIKFDEWKGPHGSKTIQRIETATQQLLTNPKVKEDIAKLASMLIKTRRARALSPDLDRWRRYCDQD